MAKRVQKKRSGLERSVLELVEEATGLLRQCSLSLWAIYYLGVIPFALAAMYIWADLSRGWDADSRVVGSALILAVLYLGMKVAQALFCDGLLCSIQGSEEKKLGFSGWLRLIGGQAVIHATALPLLGIGLLAALPFGWVYAFYHNCTSLAVSHARERKGTLSLVSQALRQARFQPWQNHGLMLIFVVFAFLVWLNVAVAFVMLPMLFKSFTGVDSILSQNPSEYLFSSTGLMSVSVIVFAIVSPVGKAFYMLRCFYGRSRETGVDLRARFGATAVLAIVVCGFFLSPAQGEDLDPIALDEAVEEVLEKREFRWRIPPEKVAADELANEDGWLGGVIKDFGKWVGSVIDAGRYSMEEFFDWIFGRFDDSDEEKEEVEYSTSKESSGFSTQWLEPAAYIVGAVMILAVVVFLARLLLQKRSTIVEDMGDGAGEPEEIDLESEEILADALPEEEWMQMVRDKAASGDLRLALRALFLATLAHLGEAKLVAIAKGKTNGEYLREMRMRGRSREDVRKAFGENVRSFEMAWYGWHSVSQEVLDEAISNHEQISGGHGAA